MALSAPTRWQWMRPKWSIRHKFQIHKIIYPKLLSKISQIRLKSTKCRRRPIWSARRIHSHHAQRVQTWSWWTKICSNKLEVFMHPKVLCSLCNNNSSKFWINNNSRFKTSKFKFSSHRLISWHSTIPKAPPTNKVLRIGRPWATRCWLVIHRKIPFKIPCRIPFKIQTNCKCNKWNSKRTCYTWIITYLPRKSNRFLKRGKWGPATWA